MAGFLFLTMPFFEACSLQETGGPCLEENNAPLYFT